MHRTPLAAVATATLIVLASPSSASPDRTVTLSRSARTVSWNGPMGVGTYVGFPAVYAMTRCQEATHSCDETLIRLRDAGDVALEVTRRPVGGVGYVNSLWIGLYLSDAAGKRGKQVTTRGTPRRGDFSGKAPGLRAGYYLLVVESDEGIGDYTATATLTPRRTR